MSKILYATDLDGTLLNSSCKISTETAESINRLLESGEHITFATARGPSTAMKLIGRIDWRLPAVVYSGLFIIDTKTGEKLYGYGSFFTDDDLVFIHKTLEPHGINPLMYSSNEKERVCWKKGAELGENGIGLGNYLNDRIGDPRLTEAETIEDLYRPNSFYCTCIGRDKELFSQVYNTVKKRDSLNVILQKDVYYDDYYLEITRKGFTKSDALLTLKEKLGCDRLVVFGDGLNDLPMFEVADEAYAVENSVLELKEKATAIIGNNDENAVADFLSKRLATN